MDKQIKYLLGVLILLLISAYFLSLLGGLPQYFKEDIISFMEERFSGEISFSSVSLWPLNRIRFDDFEFTAENGTSFKTESLNLDYSLNFNKEELISVEFIELIGADIEVQGESFGITQFLAASNSGTDSDLSNKDLISGLSLPDFFADLNVNIRNSNLIINTERLDLELSDVQCGLKTDSAENYTLSFSAGVILKQLQLGNDLEFKNFNLSNLDLKLIKDKGDAGLFFKGGAFNLEAAAAGLSKSNFNYQNFELDLKTLKGLASARGEIIFKDYRLNNYQSQIEVKDLAVQSSYKYAEGENENISLTSPALNIQAEGPELSLTLSENKIFIDQNPLDLSLKIDRSLNYQLKAEAEDFNFDYQFLSPYLNKGIFDFDLNLSGKNNQLKTAAAQISAVELSGEYTDLKSAEVSFMLDQQELFLNKAEFLLADDNRLALKGSYNFDKGNYLLTAEAENFLLTETLMTKLAQIEFFADNNYLSVLNKIKDERLDFRVDAAGRYGAEQGLSVNGDLNLSFKTAESNFEVNSSFWYTANKVMLNSFKVISDYGYLELMGELNLETEEMKLRYAAKNFEADIFNEFLAQESKVLTELNPNINYLEGSISKSFNNPTVNISLKMQEVQYENYLLEDISLSAVYKNDNLKINKFQAQIAQAKVTAAGEVKNLSRLEDAELDLNLSSQDLYFQDLADFSNQEIPLSGGIQIRAALTGKIAAYNLNLSLKADNSILEFDGQEIEFSKLQAEISRENGDFIVEDLTAKHQNSRLNAAGSFNLTKGFDIDIKLNGFELEQYLNSYQYVGENLNGSLALTGHLTGGLENPALQFQLSSEDLTFADLNIEITDNSLKYNIFQNEILISSFNFSVDSGQYNLSGKVFDLAEEIKTDLKLELLQVPTRNLTLKFIDFYPLAEELIFSGNLDFSSQGSDYNAQIDLEANSDANNKTQFKISGGLNQSLNIKFEAVNLPLDFTTMQYDFNLKLKSRLDFSGSIEGSVNSPVLRFTHQLSQVNINDTRLELINGEILLENNRRFSASESVEFWEGGNLSIDGSYSFLNDKLNLSSNLNSLPAAFLLSFLGEGLDASGELNGNLRAEGSLDSPSLDGSLSIVGEYLELGLSDPIENYKGTINLAEGKAVVESFKGDFVDGNFTINGAVNLFDLDNSWNLDLSGENLYFKYGSLEGLIDTELNFDGPLFDPVLKGEIRPYDFVIGIPFEWPTAEVEGDAFVPRIELNIIPGDNVIVENNNMEVFIESGNLNLIFDTGLENPLQMEGRFRSNEGVFTYYNSRFNLQNAEVIFTPIDENDIPSLRVNALTYVGGREITINLRGPADNMNITLSSDSEMTEDEILNLLSTRGALGSAIIGGENIGIQQIIMQELTRIANSFLQQGIINDLESDFKTAFSLDRIEIDAFQYGLEREFALYLGENLTDRLYLEYAIFFRESERDEELSFKYKLIDSTVLKGTYFGNEEYQINIETEIEF